MADKKLDNEVSDFIKSLEESEYQRRQFANTVKTEMLELIDKNEMTNKEMKELSENLFEPLTSSLFQTLYIQGGKGTNGIYRMLFGLRILDGKHLLDIAKDDYGWTEKNVPDGYGIIDTLDDLKTPIIMPKEIINKHTERNIIVSELLTTGKEILFGSPIAHNDGDWAMMFPPVELTNNEKSLNSWKDLNWKYLWDRWLVVKSVGVPAIELQDPLSNKIISVRTICIGQINGIWIKSQKIQLEESPLNKQLKWVFGVEDKDQATRLQKESEEKNIRENKETKEEVKETEEQIKKRKRQAQKAQEWVQAKKDKSITSKLSWFSKLFWCSICLIIFIIIMNSLFP